MKEHKVSEEPARIKLLIASDRLLFRHALAEALQRHGIETWGEVAEEPGVVALA